MEDLEQTSRLVFHSVAYAITTCVSGGAKLRVEAEEEEGGARWSGDFSARYVENITQKTGSAKTFPVFVKMLTTALGHGSESVFVDLLTYADLEQLKARRAGSAGNGSPQHHSAQGVAAANGGKHLGAVAANVTSGSSNSKGNMKRYLILTYVGEYDRVHYPLPLACMESPSRERPGRGADGPREAGTAEASALESTDEDQVRAENAELRRQLVALAARLEESEATAQREGVAQGENCDGGDGGGEGQKVRRLRRAYEELQAHLDDLQESHERLRVDSAAEIRKLKREMKEGVKAMDLESTRAAEATDEAAALREELEDSEQRLRLAVEEHRKEVDKLKKELAKERVTGRAMRAKIRELSSGRRAAPDTRAYQQRLRPAGRASGGRSPSSPSLGRRGGIGSASSLGQTRGVSRLRRGGSGSDGAGGGLADSSSTNRSNRSSRRSRIVGGSPGGGRGRSPLTGANRGWGLGLGRRADVTSARDRGVGQARRGRADSPRFPPAGRSTFRGGGGGGGGSRASSRGSSPASSRGRSRSTSSRKRDGDRKRSTPVFDPTAYQREREERRRRMEEERRKRERKSIGYSPGRGSGRDSWIPLSGGTGPASSPGVARGRSTVRGGGGGSGYLSAGSQASQASSRGSSIRSGGASSLSGRSSDASSRSRRRGGGRSLRGDPAEGATPHPAYARQTASARRRSVGLPDAPPPPTSNRLRPGEARLWGGRHEASPGRAGGRYNGGDGGSAVVATNGSNSPRLRPKNATSPKNYGNRHGVVAAESADGGVRSAGRADGADDAGSGRFLRLVRVSGNSSSASSREGARDGGSLYASQGAAGPRNGASGPRRDARRPASAIPSAEAASGRPRWEGEGRDGGDEEWPHRRHGSSSSWRPSAVTTASEEPARAVRARPAAPDGVVDHRARNSYDGDGADEHATVRVDAVERVGILRRSGGLRGTIGRLETNSSGAFDVSSRTKDPRQDEVELPLGGERGGGGGGARGSQEWALASSEGSLSSQRSGRRRVELRTPADEEEDEAVRRSQEISSPPSNTSSGRVAENVQGRGDPAPAERDAAGAEAGREITDIDRRLGELHEFLKRAKAGVGTGVRVPLPPPSLSRRAGDGLPANGDGQVVPLSTPLRSGGALSNSRFEGASSGGDGTRRSMTSASEGRVFGEAGWRGGEEMRRSVRGSGVLAASLGERRRGDEDVDGRERECGDREGKEE